MIFVFEENANLSFRIVVFIIGIGLASPKWVSMESVNWDLIRNNMYTLIFKTIWYFDALELVLQVGSYHRFCYMDFGLIMFFILVKIVVSF